MEPEVQEEQVQEPSLDEMIEKRKQEKLERCQTAIALALAQNGCELVPQVVITGDTFHSQVTIKVKE